MGLSYAEVAKTVGYEETYMVDSLQGLKDTLENVKEKRKLIFIEIKVSMDSRKDLGRPKETAEENKKQFYEISWGDVMKKVYACFCTDVIHEGIEDYYT